MFGAAFKQCGIHPKPNLNAKNLHYIVFGIIACVHMHVYAYTCMKHAHTRVRVRML